MYKARQQNYYSILNQDLPKVSSLWLLKGVKLTLLFLLLFIGIRSNAQAPSFQDGDLIYQDSQSRQCTAIKLATKSEHSHVGIIFIENGKPMVYEAVQPVRITPLETFIDRGYEDDYVVKRLKDPSKMDVTKLKKYCTNLLGKNYDIYFNWDDSEIYCSELAWKAYSGAGIKLCKTRPLKDYDLSHPIVKRIMKERYGKKIPLEEPMVAPSDLFSSTLMETIYSSK